LGFVLGLVWCFRFVGWSLIWSVQAIALIAGLRHGVSGVTPTIFAEIVDDFIPNFLQ
jgi:hypothetical protein